MVKHYNNCQRCLIHAIHMALRACIKIIPCQGLGRFWQYTLSTLLSLFSQCWKLCLCNTEHSPVYSGMKVKSSIRIWSIIHSITSIKRKPVLYLAHKIVNDLDSKLLADNMDHPSLRDPPNSCDLIWVCFRRFSSKLVDKWEKLQTLLILEGNDHQVSHTYKIKAMKCIIESTLHMNIDE